MNILIDTVRIAGFRGIKNLEIKLPRITVLIGTNNSGKTSILKAMQLALGDYSRYVSDEDFYIGEDEKRVNEILIDVRIVSVDENGQRKQSFDDEWASEFGDKIQREANEYQFLALRTRCKSDSTKGGFEILRSILERWSELDTWQSDKLKESKLTTRFQSISFFGIEAQRDIHQELKDKSSFSGKVLSEVSSSYNHDDVKILEKLIKNVNDDAVDKSLVLKNLKSHLNNLNSSFQGSGHAEITPFPKKIRDLSKYFSVHFGDAANNTFSMEYHGMGTRSWASMLTVMAFTDLTAEKHKNEVEPFFPILAA
jgi:putative ATP-dependent endonuclease of OLD family